VLGVVALVVVAGVGLLATRSPSPTVTASSTPISSATTLSPFVTATSTASATATASPSPVSGVATFPLGPLRGQIAWVTRTSLAAAGSREQRAVWDYELWALPLDGSTPRLAVRYQSGFRMQNTFDVRDTNILRRQLSPDGRRVLLSVATGANGANQELRIINLETGAISVPFPTGARVDVDAAWSPDGTRIAFVRREAAVGRVAFGDLWVANVDGSGARMLKAGGQASPLRLWGWLPDSQHIAFDPVNFEHAYLAVLDMNGVASPQGYEVNSVDPASWRNGSPALAAGINVSGNVLDHFQIAISDAPDQRPQQIVADVTTSPNDNTITGVRDPRWDPSGSRTLIYVEDGTQGSFVIVDLDARTTKRVSGRVARADWLPNGEAIVSLEEHPSTAPRSVYVWERDGRLRKSGLFVEATPTTPYTLTDLAARSY